MPRHKYKGITFAEGWNGTFEKFREEFETTEAFRGIQEKERLAEMKKVFNMVTKTEPKEKK